MSSSRDLRAGQSDSEQAAFHIRVSADLRVLGLQPTPDRRPLSCVPGSFRTHGAVPFNLASRFTTVTLTTSHCPIHPHQDSFHLSGVPCFKGTGVQFPGVSFPPPQVTPPHQIPVAAIALPSLRPPTPSLPCYSQHSVHCQSKGLGQGL